MLPESWITDKCPEVLDYLNKKYNLKLSGSCRYYGETKQDKYFAGDSCYKEHTYLTKEQFLEMIQEKEVWKKGDVLYSEDDIGRYYIKIIETLGDIYFHTKECSVIAKSDNMSSVHNSRFYLEEVCGYKLYKPKEKEEKIVELTLEEIAEKFNVDVKSLKIKK